MSSCPISPGVSFRSARASLPLNTANLGSLLRLCVGLTAWKEYAGSRWSLRANPSSGNLHPTETWLICCGCGRSGRRLVSLPESAPCTGKTRLGKCGSSTGSMAGLQFHPLARGVEIRRARIPLLPARPGARAGRRELCRGIARLAAPPVEHGFGGDRTVSGTGSCRRFYRCGRRRAGSDPCAGGRCSRRLPADWQHWAGKPSLLDARPLYQWPVIEEVAEATRGTPPVADPLIAEPPAVTRTQ